MGGNSGSTITARQEVGANLLTIILIVAVIIIGIACVYLISRAVSKYHNSPAYLEKKKKRPTTIKEINEVASLCGLIREEKEILIKICHEIRTPNIMFLVKEHSDLDKIFKNVYDSFKTAENEAGIYNLFSLRKKIFSFFRQKVIVKNTKFIEAGTEFTYTVSKGFHYKFCLLENNVDGLFMTVPSEINIETDMPKPLEKISLVFEVKTGAPYTLETRIVRYQDGKDGQKQVILVHSDKISGLQQRQQERADVDYPCKFNSVKVTAEKKGKKDIVTYTPSNKDYDGELEDISTGGCRLCTDLPIKADQYINIKAPFNGKKMDSAIGVIVRTTKRSDNIFVLHIRFVKIDIPVVNRINAMVVHYDD